MADPFSVAGSAVGVISLGLNICQSLISYYGSWKAYDDEIKNLIYKAEGLKSTLHTLQGPLRELESTNPSEILEVQSQVLACEAVIQKVRKRVRKCEEILPSSAFAYKLQVLGKKALYPFKRETLIWLRDTMEGLQANLNTAILMLQMCVSISSINQRILLKDV